MVYKHNKNRDGAIPEPEEWTSVGGRERDEEDCSVSVRLECV